MRFQHKRIRAACPINNTKGYKRHKFTGANLPATYIPPGSFPDLDYR